MTFDPPTRGGTTYPNPADPHNMAEEPPHAALGD